MYFPEGQLDGLSQGSIIHCSQISVFSGRTRLSAACQLIQHHTDTGFFFFLADGVVEGGDLEIHERDLCCRRSFAGVPVHALAAKPTSIKRPVCCM